MFVITPSKGVRIGIDVGTVRIGVARCDDEQIMAIPVETIQVSDKSVTDVLNLTQDIGAQVIYVGKPISLNQNETNSTHMAIKFAQQLASNSNIQVRLLDERLTTVSAQNTLQSAGKNSKSGRSIIDQVAAVILLDHAIAVEKASGTLAGEIVDPQNEQDG